MNETLYVIQRIVTELVLPPFGPLLLLLLGTMLACRFRMLGRSMQALALVSLYLLSCQGFAVHISKPLKVPQSLTPPYPAADAVVVLGGGRSFSSPEYGGETVSTNTLIRLRFGTMVAKRTNKPILVSGGRPGNLGKRSEAELMADILANEYQMPPKWQETTSNNTEENAARSAKILQAEGIQRIYLVTQATHMPRAKALFEAQGMHVVAMPTGFPNRLEPSFLLAWTPSFAGLATNRSWLYEALAKLKP